MSFFVFPLCLLGMPMTEKDLLQVIIAHAMKRAGSGGEGQKIEQYRVAATVAAWMEDGLCPNYNGSEQHNCLVRGAIVCGVSLGNIADTLARWKEAQRFIDRYEQQHGPDALVFIGTDLFWDCYNRDNPDFRHFSLLCAVNSIIGKKTCPVIIRRSMLTARQLGYKTPKIMLAAVRPDQKPLTIKQLRNALDNLEGRELLCRVQASPRNVYFSTRLLLDEMIKAVKQIMERKSKVKKRREMDREEMRARSESEGGRAMRAPDEKGPLKKEGHLKTPGPEQGQNGAKQGPQEGPLKQWLSNNSVPNNSLQITADDLSACEHAPVVKVFQQPTLTEVENFGASLHKRATTELAAQWFEAHGSDAMWTTRDWKKPYAKWLLAAVGPVQPTYGAATRK